MFALRPDDRGWVSRGCGAKGAVGTEALRLSKLHVSRPGKEALVVGGR